MKKYFAKYLPVEGYGDVGCKWQWNNNVKNTGWEDISRSDMDAIIAHCLNPPPQFRKLKLFLCTTNIQVGDKIGYIGSSDYPAITANEIDAKTPGYFKVIGEILTPGIKEGQEFTEKETEYLTIGE